MRRTLLTLSFLVLGSLSFTSAARAQVTAACPSGAYDAFGNCQASTGAAGAADTSAASAATAANQQAGLTSTGGVQTTQIPASASKMPTSADKDPNLSGGFSSVMIWIMSLFAWLVGVAAMALDYAVYYTVVTMGNYIHELKAIGISWRILRDIGNIALIFGFIATGIATILQVDIYGARAKLIPKLLLAAVFLNFSLFATEAVIDVGNLFATQFFNQINGGNPVSPDFLQKLNTSNEGISNKLMAQLGLQTLYTAGRVNTDIYKSENLWLIGFLGIILFLVTAFVMFTLAFILIARFVMLIFLIITSPIAVAGFAIPQLESRAKEWWHKLFEQTITAPILLLLLYVALAVITDAQFLTGICQGSSCSWTSFIPGTNTAASYPGFAGLLLSFLIAMGLLLVVVAVSKGLSAAGASWASQTAGKLTFGATAFGLRSTFGMGSRSAAQAIRRSKWGGTTRGRVLATAFDKGAKGSFDLRGVKVAGASLQDKRIDAGKPAEGGYSKRLETKIKGYTEYAESVGKAVDEKGATKEEKAIIEAADTRQKKADVAAKTATREKDNADKAYAQSEAAFNTADKTAKELEAEVKRLTDLESSLRNDRTKVGTPELKQAQTDLAKKKQELEEAKTRKEAAELRQKEAEAIKKAAQTAKGNADKELEAANEAKKVADGQVAARKKAAQEAYADAIERNPFAWTVHGPGMSAAAKKIRTSAKSKTSKDKIADAVKELIEADEKDKKSTEPVAPTGGGGGTPAAGGADHH